MYMCVCSADVTEAEEVMAGKWGYICWQGKFREDAEEQRMKWCRYSVLMLGFEEPSGEKIAVCPRASTIFFCWWLGFRKRGACWEERGDVENERSAEFCGMDSGKYMFASVVLVVHAG